MMSPLDAGSSSGAISRHVVLVMAPLHSDAKVLADVLDSNGMASARCANRDELAGHLDQCAALVMSQEALASRTIETVARHLEAQPAWSELPLILIMDEATHGSSVLSALRRRLARAQMVILQRPVRVVEFVSAAQNALATRRRQLELRDHIEWQQELQRELNHRVKNILANVSAIYHMTLRRSGSLADFATSFEGRLSALSQVHSALAVAGKAQPLVLVAERALAPYRSDGDERVILSGPPVELRPDTAVILALGLHELATNAAKYGAFSTSTGSVSLRWQMVEGEGEPRVKIVWTERGGPPVDPPTRQGYGTRFVRSALESGTGTAVDLQFARQGVTCTFVIPVASDGERG
jgi:two-component sensor histidine kinase